MKLQNIFLRLSLIIGFTIILASCIKAPQFDVMFNESQITVYENDSSFIIELILPDGAMGNDVEVAYSLGGTAKLGRDYTTRDEDYIFIPEGETSKTFTINLIDNVLKDGQRTIEVTIVLVIFKGNTIYQGAERQSVTVLIEDDDCSPDISGEWDYTAVYFMHSLGDTLMVGQDGDELEEGVNPEFAGTVTIVKSEGYKDYFINDMFIGMFSILEIETPSPIHDECGVLSGPNDGSVLLMRTLPAQLFGEIVDDDTIEMEFEYMDVGKTGGGFGQARLIRKK